MYANLAKKIGTSQKVDIDSNLIAYYQFNNNVNDSINSLNGTTTNISYVNDRDGNPLSAGLFSLGFADIGNNALIQNLHASDFTLNVWVKANYTELGSGSRYIFGSGDPLFDGFSAQIFNSNQVIFKIQYTVNAEPVWNVWTDDDDFKMLTFVFKNKVAMLYYNSEYKVKNSGGDIVSGSYDSDSAYNKLIGDKNGGSSPFNGTMDNMRIYNRALNLIDIKHLYNNYL